MQEPAAREEYPVSTVIVANLVTLLVYAIGAFILSRYSTLLVIACLLFILALEFRLVRGHCVDCYYFKKTCAFGRGRLSALFFCKGSPENFCHTTMTWKDILPDFLLFIVPAIAGIALLVSAFSTMVLVLVIALLILGFAGNAFVRANLACRFCRQRVIGCPAEKLFEKREKS